MKPILIRLVSINYATHLCPLPSLPTPPRPDAPTPPRPTTMLPSPHTPVSDAPQRKLLPNYLLSASPAPPSPSSAPFQTASPGGAIVTPTRHEITFNARLREDHAPSLTPTPRSVDTRTPSRKPPSKSLLDVGPPSIHSVRSPSASPALTSLTPSQPHAHRWVTVFGFPPALESQALREFRRHGDVVRTVPGNGNWLHVLYRTPMQAQVALHKPWRLLAGTDVMVGAVPCTEPAVARDNDDAVEKGFLVASPGGVSPFAPPAITSPSPSTPSVTPGATPGLRTPASVLRRDRGSVPQSIVRTPQRQPGFFDYLTGLYR